MSHDRYRMECAEYGPDCLAFYDRLIDEGNNPGFAAMLAMRKPCGTKGTERAFLEGSHHWADKLNSDNAEYILGAAKKAGIPTAGKVYKGGLGRPDDALAWVSTIDDVKAACKKKGYSCEGAVSYKAPERQFKKKRMGEDVVQDYMAREVEKDPSIPHSKKKMKNLRSQVIEKHSKKNL
mgnify:FL=1